MGTVTTLPINARVLNAMRETVNLTAQRYGASERERLRAFGRAFHLVEQGSSTAWACQAARQQLRDRPAIYGWDGGSAA